MSRLTLTGAGGPSAFEPDPRRVTGLLFAYNLDETDDGTRYPFDSKGPDLSTVVNAPDDVEGIIGRALQGDGTQYVKSTDASIETLIDGLGNFTVSFWYKRTNTDAAQMFVWNFGYQDPNVQFGGSGGAYVYHRFYLNDTISYYFYEYTPNTIWDWDDGNWHHFVYTFDGSQANADKLKMYYDNVDISTVIGTLTTAPSATAIATTVSEMEIGSNVDGHGPISGSVDLFGFWNWTMTPDDVAYEYNGGSAQAFVAE